MKNVSIVPLYIVLPITAVELPGRQAKFGLSEEIGPWLVEQCIKHCSTKLAIDTEALAQVTEDRLKSYMQSYGILLHESDIVDVLGSDITLSDLKRAETFTPFPIFQIDNRQTKRFALLLEVVPFDADGAYGRCGQNAVALVLLRYHS